MNLRLFGEGMYQSERTALVMLELKLSSVSPRHLPEILKRKLIINFVKLTNGAVKQQKFPGKILESFSRHVVMFMLQVQKFKHHMMTNTFWEILLFAMLGINYFQQNRLKFKRIRSKVQ